MNAYARRSSSLSLLTCSLLLAWAPGCSSDATGGDGAVGDVTADAVSVEDTVEPDGSAEVIEDSASEDVMETTGGEDVGTVEEVDTGGVCSEAADTCGDLEVPAGGCVSAFECDPGFTDEEGGHCRPVYKAPGSPCMGGPDGAEAQVVPASAVATGAEASVCDRYVCFAEGESAPECLLASTIPQDAQAELVEAGQAVEHVCALTDMPSDVSRQCNDWACGCATAECLEAECQVKPNDDALGQACEGVDACYTGTCYVVPSAPYACVQSPVDCPAVSDASCVVMPGCDGASGCPEAMDQALSDAKCQTPDPCLASAVCDPESPEADPETGCVLVLEDPGSACGDALVSIRAGGGHTLALQADGVLWGWGVPSYWQPPEGLLFQRIAAGKSHSCGIDLSGSVHCWGIQDGGNWDFGQVTLTPTQGSYIDVATGYNHSCAVQSDGAVVCWGIGSEDNLTEAQEPYEKGQVKDTPAEAMFLEVGAGHSFSCGLKTDGGVQCWGGGSGMTNVPTETDFVSLTVGFHHACALDSSGAITCWGWTKLGLIADVPEGAFQSVSCGYGHTCAVRTSGEVVCWGVPNESDGAPQVVDTGQATDAPDEASFKLVGVNSSHSCAVTNDDKVVCWGAAGSKSTPPAALQP
ncbi:MAG: hypothetical protein CL940_07130 [Deltaproteobacteria bacterium]|nr:hypothetical protein [Deltaproteobacteria bacterium]